MAGTALLVCEDGNDTSVYSKHCGSTDFPPEGIRFYYTNNVLSPANTEGKGRDNPRPDLPSDLSFPPCGDYPAACCTSTTRYLVNRATVALKGLPAALPQRVGLLQGRQTMRNKGSQKNRDLQAGAGLIDSFIILLISGAVVLFLLWAAYKRLGMNNFDVLPQWLERGYNAIWTALAAGTAGVGLAIVKGLQQRRPDREKSTNYLLLIGITTLVMLALIVGIPKLAIKPSAYVESEVISGGFTPSFMGGLPMLAGTTCGQTSINFSETDIKINVNDWKEVTWDASYICRRQGIAGAVQGSINWGTPASDITPLPGAAPAYGEWGKMKFRYLQPGHYTVSMDMAVSCIDVGMPPNPCRATGRFNVTVEP